MKLAAHIYLTLSTMFLLYASYDNYLEHRRHNPDEAWQWNKHGVYATFAMLVSVQVLAFAK